MRERLVRALAARLPVYYGWVILACVCAASFSRQGPAVATLSIFIAPMTTAFGWSMTEISLAASIGGILGALVSPLTGTFLDRHGARVILCFAVLTTGVALSLLSLTGSLFFFYAFYSIARMNFTGPFDIGIYGSIVNWFVRRRTFVTSITTLAMMSGLVAMPLIAHFVMQASDWRVAWLVIGLTVLVVALLPCWLLLVRRPEDLGLLPDGDMRESAGSAGESRASEESAAQNPATQSTDEPAFTRRDAIRTPAFWLLSLFTLLVYPVQAGVSLHQAPLLIERGLDPTIAATAVSTFSLFSAIVGFAYGFWPRRLPLRLSLALTGVTLGSSCLLMNSVDSAAMAYGAAALFGAGIGGLVTMLPVAWADYFGRRSFGAIRGLALTIQVIAQAMGPLISGALHDWTGSYNVSLATFATLAFAGAVAALLAVAPKGPSVKRA